MKTKILACISGVAAIILVVWAVAELRLGRSETIHLPPAGVQITYYAGREGAFYSFADGRVNLRRVRLDNQWEVSRFVGQLRQEVLALIIKDNSSAANTKFCAILDEDGVSRVKASTWSSRLDDISPVGDKIVAPTLERGNLVLRELSKSGAMRVHTTLSMPGDKITSLLSPVSVSGNGLTVATLTTRGNSTPTIYLFERGHRAPFVVGSGYEPVLTQDGRRIGYIEAEPGGGLSRSYKVAVFDVASRRAKTLRAWRPVHLSDLCPLWTGHPLGVVSLQWSENGRWLLCALMVNQHYDQMLVALDVDSKIVRRYKFPFNVEPMKWVSFAHQPHRR
ncbi:MAG: hypothetical protein ACOX3G_05455 [Armatimonadota bacterium]|jgi:WD40 repeat protein